MISENFLNLIIKSFIFVYYLINQIINTKFKKFNYFVLTNIFVRYFTKFNVFVFDLRLSLLLSIYVFQNIKVVL